MEDQLSHLSSQAQKDYQLIQLAIAGDEDAYAKLLARYNDTIYFKILKLVKNKTDAEDLTIETFSKAFNNLDSYNRKFAFSTWLHRIAKNNAIDFLRKNKGVFISIDSESEEDELINPKHIIQCENLNPEQGLIKKQKAIMVHNSLRKIKPQYRELLDLRYFGEFTYEEIASSLNMPIGTVKVQLHRAKQQLFTIMENSDID